MTLVISSYYGIKIFSVSNLYKRKVKKILKDKVQLKQISNLYTNKQIMDSDIKEYKKVVSKKNNYSATIEKVEDGLVWLCCDTPHKDSHVKIHTLKRDFELYELRDVTLTIHDELKSFSKSYVFFKLFLLFQYLNLVAWNAVVHKTTLSTTYHILLVISILFLASLPKYYIQHYNNELFKSIGRESYDDILNNNQIMLCNITNLIVIGVFGFSTHVYKSIFVILSGALFS